MHQMTQGKLWSVAEWKERTGLLSESLTKSGIQASMRLMSTYSNCAARELENEVADAKPDVLIDACC